MSFGHYPDRGLAERAAKLVRERNLSPNELIRMANSVTSGMLYIFEMDFGFGGSLRQAPPHPGLAAWIELSEHWADRKGLTLHDKLDILTVGAALGSDRLRSKLEVEVLLIEDLNTPEWLEDDKMGYTLSRALREVQRRKPLLPLEFIEKILQSQCFNIAAQGIAALEAIGDRYALQRLIDLHCSISGWHLRDSVANSLESMAAKQNVIILKEADNYNIAYASETKK